MKRALASLLVLTTGCVSIGLGEAVVVEERPLDNRRVVVPTQLASVDVDQEDTTLTITAERVCDIEQKVRVQQTLERERVNLSPGVTWQLAIYGAILAGVGTGVTIDARLNVADSDPEARSYNSIGPDAATAIGAAFLAAGTPLLVIAVVDAIRATGSESEIAHTERSAGFIERSTRCETRVPMARSNVMGRTNAGTPINLGDTDARGVLAIDLADVVSEDVTLREGAKRLALFMGRQPIGSADLKPVASVHREAARVREDQEWAALDVTACEEGSQPDCQAVEAFLQKHPDGQHAPRARIALKTGRDAMKQREAEARQKQQASAAAAAKAAEEQRKKAEAARVCRQKCASGCKSNQQCTSACVAAQCN